MHCKSNQGGYHRYRIQRKNIIFKGVYFHSKKLESLSVSVNEMCKSLNFNQNEYSFGLDVKQKTKSKPISYVNCLIQGGGALWAENND